MIRIYTAVKPFKKGDLVITDEENRTAWPAVTGRLRQSAWLIRTSDRVPKGKYLIVSSGDEMVVEDGEIKWRRGLARAQRYRSEDAT